MSKRRDDEEEESGAGAGWLTTYSDMVTLLFAFFVLLFAISNVDVAKASLLFEAFGKGLTEEQFIFINDLYNRPAVDGDGDTPLGPSQHGDEFDDDKEGDDPGEEEDPLAGLFEQIEYWIFENNLGESIHLMHKGDHLLLTLANDVWFASGSAELTNEMKEKGAILAQLLLDNQIPDDPFDIVIAGHTDNVPINTVRYPSNWELSFARASAFLTFIKNETELPGKTFSGRGYGEEAPIATNETPEGRQLNRRVEVQISHLSQQRPSGSTTNYATPAPSEGGDNAGEQQP